MKPSRARYLQVALGLIGTQYLWGGRSRKGVDCSGTPILALHEASGGKVDLRAGWWTERLWEELPMTEHPLPGDLVFYPGHTMLLLHNDAPWCRGGMVFGASGGDSSTTSYERAMEQGALVCVKRSIHYRDGFRGFRSISPYLDEAA
jgi:cell wall-associated NlpC family hydrolase